MSVADRIAALAPQQRALLEKLREEQRKAAQRRPPPPIQRVAGVRAGGFPLSYAQQRLWFLHQLDPDSPAYNLAIALRFTGELDVAALAAAIGEVARRHEILRTRFTVEDGQPVQVIDPPRPLALARIDLSAFPGEGELRRVVHQESARPFDLEAGPLFRTVLFRLAPREHLLLATLHHIVADGWSGAVLVQEVGAFYVQGRGATLPELPVQYADYAVWQRSWLSGEVLQAELDWWREKLAGAPPRIDLPTDRPRGIAGWRAGKLPIALPSDLSRGLTLLGQRAGATPFMVLMAALQVLLGRYSRQDDLPVATVVANRMRPEIEGLIGFFVNTLVLRGRLDGDLSFSEHVKRTRAEMLAASQHQEVSFEQVVEAARPERAPGEIPFFQTLFVLQNAPHDEADLPGLQLASETVDSEEAKLDLALEIYDRPEGFVGGWEYRADLFDAATVARMTEHLCSLLQAAVNDPDCGVFELQLLSPAACHQILAEWDDTSWPLPGGTVPRRFVEQAARTPDATALFVGGVVLTYRELDRRSDTLARRLRAAGIGAESRVALLLGRTPEIVISILATWKAGGAIVPLDTDSPGERLWALLTDAEPAIVVHQGPLPVALPAGVCTFDLAAESLQETPEADPAPELPSPADLAYLIYTSGTTGRPKAVMVEHGSLAAILGSVAHRFGFGPDDRWPHASRFTFDISLAELFLPLLAGGVCELLAGNEVLETDNFLDALERSTILSAVPALMRRIAAGARQRGPERFARLRLVIVGGDTVPADLQGELLATFPASEIAVLYGPTETAILATAHRVSRASRPERPLIGRPLANVEARIVDRAGRPVPLGVPGELWIGGPGVARGYFRREKLTAERFVQASGRRFYRTGDLVRQPAAAGGVLEFLGRTDHQIKIRGFRIEPGEIEGALLEHPAVRHAVVAALPDGTGDRRLIGYVEPTAPCQSSELREHLAARLPSYMVPALFVFLSELPLSANGKVDRARLPAPESLAEESAGAPPQTPSEEVVAGIWSEVLGLSRISRTANFFELGGHSLLATQVVSRLRTVTGAELPVGELFQSPTVTALAAALEAALSASSSSASAPPIRPVPRRGDLPLSFAQERLWFLDRLAPGNAGYHIPLALTARGELSLPAMAAALGEMVRRHEALRTAFAARGDRPVQVIAPPAPRTLPVVDLSGLPEPQRLATARRLAGEAVARPFDLTRDPVLRAHALRLGADEHALLLVVHHIAADGWSVGVMVGEIAALYPVALKGEASPLPDLAVQYADFAVWQRAWLQGEVLDRQLGYWRERLAGAPALDLPTDRPRPPVQSFRGATRMDTVGPETTQALKIFARRHDATPFMVLLAALQALLGRWAGQEDVVVGSPIANRTRAEIEPLIGFFVNTLALRGDLSDDPPFGELVARSRRAALEAYSHQDLPFERLVEELRPERRLSHNPLFQVMFAVQNAPLGAVELPGLTFSPVDFEFPATRFDLEVFFTESDRGLATQLTWSTDLFDATTVLRLRGHLDSLLEAVLADPARRLSEFPFLPVEECHQLLAEWNDTAAGIPEEDVVTLFAEQAQYRPEAVAVSAAEGDLTYAELDRRAARLARRLAAAGVGPEVRVALLAQRSAALVVGVLGILKAGGAYVPLDPSYPAERLAWMLADSGARVLLGQPGLLAELPEEVVLPVVIELTAGPEEIEGPDPMGPLPGGLAYVMYTSGSTGRPKGVGVTHRNIVRLVRESGFADLGADQVFLQLAPISFDASTLELWAPLLNGGRVAVFPPRRPSLEELAEAISRFGVTSLWLTAGLFHQMVENRLEALKPLRQLLAGGDVLSPPHVQRALAGLPDVTLINGYGPTEGTTFTCCFPMNDAERVGASVPIGRPIGNTRVYVLGASLRPVPAGVWGDLFAAGGGLSRGYLGSPDLTAERFVPDPFAGPGEEGSRLYRTGDVVRFRPDGCIEFLGRRDGQVKLRGFRVELGEIESALVRHPEVREAAVMAIVARDDGGPAGRRLVAYVVPRPAPAGADDRSEGGLQHVEQWRELYDQTYAQGPPPGAGGDAAFNIQGWNSSYTDEPIPAVEMREWLDGTVGRLLGLPHRRVLEVGCGTGLLLFHVAPEAERYRGTDFSAVALAQVRAELDRLRLPQVELAQRLADDWNGVRPGDFDLVILNSVVQYFPSVDYLVRVLEGAVAAVAPGGAIFVGDVRSLPLLEAFHASVQIHQAASSLPVAELMRRVRRRVAEEEELVIDPALFFALARRLPRVHRVQVLLKRGCRANELTRFRYDVVLHVGDGDAVMRARHVAPLQTPQDWDSEGLTLAGLERRLEAKVPDLLALSGIPNARLAGEVAALELLAGAGREMETAAELRGAIEQRVRERAAVDPEDLWALADRLGYDADLTWSAAGRADGRFDAVLRRREAVIPVEGIAAGDDDRDLPWSAWANDPLRADQARRLVPDLRRFLESELPDYMVPSTFVLLDGLPLTPNGKVDRAALPEPERPEETAAVWIAPATPLEEMIAKVVAEVLGIERVGMGDNFFALGGHSLLATQLVSRLVQHHGVQVTLQMVFDSPSLADLADQIVQRELESVEGELLEEALDELEGLSPQELQAMLEQASLEEAR